MKNMMQPQLSEIEKAEQGLFRAVGGFSFFIDNKAAEGCEKAFQESMNEARERVQIAALAYARACGLK